MRLKGFELNPCHKCGHNPKISLDFSYSIECSYEECSTVIFGGKEIREVVKEWNILNPKTQKRKKNEQK